LQQVPQIAAAAAEVVRYSSAMRRLACVIGALAVTAGGAGASTITSGLRGSVMMISGGACLQDGSCGKRPLADAMLVFTLGNRSVRARTNDDGAFRVRLSPGTYAVRLGTAPGRRPLSPASASVVRGKMRTMTFVVGGPKIP
jgi:hypothetical protein